MYCNRLAIEIVKKKIHRCNWWEPFFTITHQNGYYVGIDKVETLDTQYIRIIIIQSMINDDICNIKFVYIFVLKENFDIRGWGLCAHCVLCTVYCVLCMHTDRYDGNDAFSFWPLRNFITSKWRYQVIQLIFFLYYITAISKNSDLCKTVQFTYWSRQWLLDFSFHIKAQSAHCMYTVYIYV